MNGIFAPYLPTLRPRLDIMSKNGWWITLLVLASPNDDMEFTKLLRSLTVWLISLDPSIHISIYQPYNYKCQSMLHTSKYQYMVSQLYSLACLLSRSLYLSNRHLSFYTYGIPLHFFHNHMVDIYIRSLIDKIHYGNDEVMEFPRPHVYYGWNSLSYMLHVWARKL